jgi:hypothetical protein
MDTRFFYVSLSHFHLYSNSSLQQTAMKVLTGIALPFLLISGISSAPLPPTIQSPPPPALLPSSKPQLPTSELSSPSDISLPKAAILGASAAALLGTAILTSEWASSWYKRLQHDTSILQHSKALLADERDYLQALRDRHAKAIDLILRMGEGYSERLLSGEEEYDGEFSALKVPKSVVESLEKVFEKTETGEEGGKDQMVAIADILKPLLDFGGQADEEGEIDRGGEGGSYTANHHF